MKTKEELLKSYFEEGTDAKSDGHLSMLTVVNVLEVLIDIRDILHRFISMMETSTMAQAILDERKEEED